VKGLKERMRAAVARPAPVPAPLSLEERARRADELMKARELAEASTTASESDATQATIAGETTIATESIIAKDDRNTSPEATIDSQATNAQTATIAPQATIQVEARPGYTKLPHTVADGILPLLDPFEQVVYLRLYRLVHGFKGRDEVLVSFDKLAEITRVSKRQVVRAVDRLEALGLVERTPQLKGKRGQRGNVYRVPEQLIATQATIAGETTIASGARMKSSEKKRIDKAPVAAASAPVSIRSETNQKTLARAFVFQLRHDEPGISDARIRELAGPWADEQGIELRFVDAAIG
jgi:DNA-binding transcriptional ArsR family regulator